MVSGSSGDILERSRTREVTGVFHSREALEAAAEDLLVSGVDRADIDVSASVDEMQRRVNYPSNSPADAADMPTVPRHTLVEEDDLVGVEAVIGSLFGCAGAVAMAFYLISRGMSPLPAILLSGLTGLVLAAIAI